MRKIFTLLHYLLHLNRIKGEISQMELNDLTHAVIGTAMKVHTSLGPGLLESSYKEMLFYKLKAAGLKVEKEVVVPLIVEGIKIKCSYRMDLLVEDLLVVEIKSVNAIHPVHVAQVLTYLRTGGYKVGLLINFKTEHLRHGIKRVIL